ncbi:hypothetical protein KY362_05985 [Candidatus Woesearchaeota archaeon]|nr:hypothetical protein [Candidatus Woesearchaeota archaeon]
MTFDSDKETFLAKEDKSLKGSIDGHIKALCDLINSINSYYTTSSCSGRTVLLSTPDSGKKNEAEWIFVSHDEVGEYTLSSELTELPPGEVWFRFEPLILHVVCRTIEDAGRLISAVQSAGIKRSGIISVGKKIVAEIIGTERIDTLVAKDKTLLVSIDYLSTLIASANSKMNRNWENIRKIEAAVRAL